MADYDTGGGETSTGTTSISFAVPERVLGDEKIPYEVLKYIPEESARHYSFAPLAVQDGILEVGLVDPENIAAIDALNFIARRTGMPFKVFKLSEADFQKVLGMYRGLSGEVERAVSDLRTEEGQKAAPAIDDLSGVAPLDLDVSTIPSPTEGVQQVIQDDAPTIKIASTILRYAIDGKASDIHIEPSAAGVRVRYRVDGDLHTSVVLPLNTHRALVARIKVLASIRLDEQRKPQDGRFSAHIGTREIDFRVSTFPSIYGEKVVIRILDRDHGFIALDKIGLSDRNLSLIRTALTRPHGLVLISGPTGSGKSTTLYSMLSELDREHKNVLSLEDPVEYYVDGVAQSQMRPEIGYNFATGLRTTLRQDPDIIMVGEIRDGETAKLAIQAALTGHLVFSTIHTNDAVGTVTRLVNMGVEPYLIPPVLVLSIAQRLVRTLCPGTGKAVEMSPAIRRGIEERMQSLPLQHRFPIENTIYEPEPSPGCASGMRGRMAVFEVMEMDRSIEKIILENPVENEIHRAVRAQGMLTMQEDAIQKAFAKKIPFSEVDTLSTVLGGTDEGEPLVAQKKDIDTVT